MRDKIFLYTVPLSDVVQKKANLAAQRKQIQAFKYYLLSVILGTKITQNNIRYTKRGKPYLADRAFSFSVSHSQAYYAMTWMTHWGDIGLDLESSSRIVALKVIKKTLAECEWLEWVYNGQNRADFLYFWTQKEAFLKAKGLSVITKLDQLFFETKDPLDRELVVSSYDHQTYRMMPIQFSNQVGMVCTNQLQSKELEWVRL